MNLAHIKSLSYEELKELAAVVNDELYRKNPENIAQREREAKFWSEREKEAKRREAKTARILEALRKVVTPGMQLKMTGCKDGYGIREFIRWEEDNLVCWKIDGRTRKRTTYVTTHFPDKVSKLLTDGKIIRVSSLLT